MNTHFEMPRRASEGTAPITLGGGHVLQPDGEFVAMDLHMAGGVICDEAPTECAVLDLSDCLILPGIIDAHGDGFENHLLPRVGAEFPDWIALRNVDRELVANGITTAYLAQSYSWEGGIRGIEAARGVIEGIRALQPPPASDMRVQIRYETFFLDGSEQLLTWLEDGVVEFVVFNDHVPQYQELYDEPERIARWASTVGLSIEEFRALLKKTVAEGVGVLDNIARISSAMTRFDLPFGSHDDPDPDTRRRYNKVGARIAEFPLSVATAQEARRLGNSIVMGAPNALRGKSASSNVSARELIALELCDVLVSDYYYPALLHAPFALTRDGVTDLSTAWALVSSGPAQALGLTDRAALAPDQRADVVVIRQDTLGRPHVMATFVAGRTAFLDASLSAGALTAKT